MAKKSPKKPLRNTPPEAPLATQPATRPVDEVAAVSDLPATAKTYATKAEETNKQVTVVKFVEIDGTECRNQLRKSVSNS